MRTFEGDRAKKIETMIRYFVVNINEGYKDYIVNWEV